MSQIFANGNDDYMFPTTQPGIRAAGTILENASQCETGKGCVFETAIENDALANTRAKAMSAVLSWLEDGELSYNSLDETIIVVADIDGDYELTEEEEDYYSDIWNQIPDAMLSLGADIDDVQEFVNGPGTEADKAAARIGKALVAEMDATEADDDSLISGFVFGEDAILESCAYDEKLRGILEATYKRKKVVRDGKVQIVKKRVSGKVRLSSAQKASLKKARRKANTATAKLARRKSMKIRATRGL